MLASPERAAPVWTGVYTSATGMDTPAMIERYVFIRLIDEHATDEGRRAVIEHTQRVLPAIPGVTGVQMSTPADDESAKAWDLGLVVRFDAIEDVDPYRVHPDHVAYLDFLEPRVAVKKAWNFSPA